MNRQIRLVNSAPVNSGLTLAMCLLLTGCAGNMDDLIAYTEATKQKYPGSVQPLPEFEPYQNHVYSAQNYRGPFTRPANKQNVEVTDNGLKPDIERRKEPLEFFPLDSLTMVGTLERYSESWALIRDPDGTIHRVQPGNHAGENYGEIIRISETNVDFLEIIPDGLGGWIEREVSLTINDE